ncbi:hypothetical protein KY329_01080 [Candidatus Woesearchaeota archaeon]|nr:hypothetical protein [Candidatus Woesearchaeota archaeon]
MALEYLPDSIEIEPRYISRQTPLPRDYKENRFKRYVRIVGKAAAIIGALLSTAKFLWGDGILVDRKPPQVEQHLEEIVEDSLGLLEPGDEQNPD